MRNNSILVSLAVTATLLTIPSPLRAQSPQQNALARSLFIEGRDLWDDGKFGDAEKKFREALTGYPKADQSDRTSYYLITTLIKLGRTDEARAEINTFNRKYPQSTWKSDVEEKRLTLNGLPLNGFQGIYRGPAIPSVASPVRGLGANYVVATPFSFAIDVNADPSLQQELLRLIVEKDANRGIEVARLRLKGNPSDPAVISNLSTIAVSGSPQAMPFLLMLAGSSPNNPNVRSQAVFWIGRSLDKDAVGRAVIEMMKQKEAIPVVADALGHFNPNEQRHALEQIVQRPAGDRLPALQNIFRNSTNPVLRAQVVHSVGSIAEPPALSFLTDVARTERQLSVRRAAIQTLATRKDVDVKMLEEILQTLPVRKQ